MLDDLYSADFAGVGFFELDQGNARPGVDQETAGTKYSTGGGNHIYIDCGRSYAPFEIAAGMNTAEYTAIRAKRGDSGTLTWSRGSMSATLLDVTPQPGKAGPLEAYTVVLRFWSTDTPTSVGASEGMITESSEFFITEAGEYIVQE